MVELVKLATKIELLSIHILLSIGFSSSLHVNTLLFSGKGNSLFIKEGN